MNEMETQSIDIKILIATHKHYQMPSEDIYLPVHVGAYGKESIGYTRDDDGDNISDRNKNYCELTGLYWAWKNTKSDYLGLVHYRRYFMAKSGMKSFVAKNKWDCVLDRTAMEKYIDKLNKKQIQSFVLLPQKRNYFIETNYSQYVHAHHKEDLDLTREIILEKYPDYIPAYEQVMKSTKGHRFNMFIMDRKSADAYCEWVFSILFELEKRLDISNYSDNDKRVYGFVSERLLDVWIVRNEIYYCELPVMFMEKENWPKKICGFLRRKFG